MKRLSSLSWQIIKRVIIVYGIVALVLTSIQLWIDYRENLKLIKKNLTSSYEMFGSSMSEALYHANTQMIENIFHGILSQNDFVGAAVYDRLADEFIVRGKIEIDLKKIKPYLADDSLSFSLEDAPDTIIYQHSMKITTVLDEKRYFGNLIVFSNKQLAFERIKSTMIIVFLNSLVKAVVLITMFLLIFNRLLIQPLTNIINVMKDLSSENLNSTRLDLGSSKSRELALLEIRFNKLLDELQSTQEKQKLLQQKAKFIEMGEMVGNIAHQWRQPLSTVNTVIALLLAKQENKSLDPAYLHTRLIEIEKLNEYMSDTIEDFLRFFKPNKVVEDVEVKDVIDNTLRLLKAKIIKEEIDIEVNVPSDLLVKTNKQDLMQVLMVLISNSIDSVIEKGDQYKRKIEINVELSGLLFIFIKDYGVGISEDIIDRIFEPYFTKKHKAQGTGLGLYLAKMIVEESLKGKITLTNHEYGATALVTLPIHT